MSAAPSPSLPDALFDLQKAVGDVVAPRLRALARGDDGWERARAGLITHLGDPALTEQLLAIEPGSPEARELAAAVGVTLRGGPRREDERRSHIVKVYLSAAERGRLDELRGEEDAAVYLRRCAGLGSATTEGA